MTEYDTWQRPSTEPERDYMLDQGHARLYNNAARLEQQLLLRRGRARAPETDKPASGGAADMTSSSRQDRTRTGMRRSAMSGAIAAVLALCLGRWLWTGDRLWVLGSVLVVPVFATAAGLGSLIASPRHPAQDGR